MSDPKKDDKVTLQLPRDLGKERELEKEYKSGDAAKDTGVSTKEAESAWAEAAVDAADG